MEPLSYIGYCGKSLDSSLAALKMDYVDMLLMHWPVAFKHDENMEVLNHSNGKVLPFPFPHLKKASTSTKRSRSRGQPVIDESLSNNHVPTWRAMEALVAKGKVRSLGVSNFSIAKLEALLPTKSKPTPGYPTRSY